MMDNTTVLSVSMLDFELVWTLLIIVRLHTMSSLVCDENRFHSAFCLCISNVEILKIFINGGISRLEGGSDVHTSKIKVNIIPKAMKVLIIVLKSKKDVW